MHRLVNRHRLVNQHRLVNRHRLVRLLSGTLVVGLALVVVPTTSAQAGAGGGIGTWTPLTGHDGDYTTSVQVPALGFPEAHVQSDSRSGGVGVQTGTSTWFGDATPPGQLFGSSQNQSYLTLRPKADTAGAPSTTTYSFDTATPQGWGFVLGDVDADKVHVEATTADGTAATTAQLGFRSTFNLCDDPPEPSGCSTTEPKDAPTWNTGTATLNGNSDAKETYGASGWFEPTVPLRTLTFTFTRRAGFPVFQTWFGVRRQDVNGTVSVGPGSGGAGACALGDIRLDLVDAQGDSVSNTTASATGDFQFEGVSAGTGYHVAIGGLPDGCVLDTARSVAVDMTTDDAVADFTIHHSAAATISGAVHTADGDPVPGATVTIEGPGSGLGNTRTTTTDELGGYVFDGNAAGAYALTATADGYTLASSPSDAVVPTGSTDAVTGKDFVLTADPTVSGTVTGADGAVAGATVVLRHGGTEIGNATTGQDGSYDLPRVAPGDYTATIPDPPGSFAVPSTLHVQVGSGDSTGNDFSLTRPGSVAGTVTDSTTGKPVAAATLRVTGPGEHVTVTTDAEGHYYAGDLTAGAYRIVLTPPDGTRADGRDSRTVTITSAGQYRYGQDFAVATARTTGAGSGGGSGGGSGSGSGGGSGSGSGGVGAASSALPGTGGTSGWWIVGGLVLVVAGGATVFTSVFTSAFAGRRR